MKKLFLCLVILISYSYISFSQVTETFTKRWETSFGFYSNHVAADTRSDESFYAAFDVRKLESDPDYYTTLVKYGCEGQVQWRIGLETPSTSAGDERLVDIAVLPNGEIGVLQEVGKYELFLHWISRGGALNTTLRIDLPEVANAWELLPHPNNTQFLITMAYDIENQSKLALLEVDDNGDILTQYIGNDIESGPLSHWYSADELAVKTGRGIKIINLNTAQVRGYDLPNANLADGGVYAFEDYVYLTYIEEAGDASHLVKLNMTNGSADWHSSIELTNRSGFMYTHVDGVGGQPHLMMETGGNGAEVYFAEIDATTGDIANAAKINDADFISYLGDFDIDETGKYIYCGSQFSNGVNDFSARVDYESECILILGSEISSTSISNTQVEPRTFNDLTGASFTVTTVAGQEYSDFPPEDYLCKPGTDSLSQLFQDTIVCDSVLVISHNLTGDYMFNGMPIPETIVIEEDGVYQVSLQRCNTTDRVNFNVEFEDCDCQLYFPNTFTPNGDNLNDVFLPEGNCNYTDYSMLIYDRWGNLIFESQERFAGWNGTYKGSESRPGVYTYLIRLTSLPSNEERVETGTITLIR